MKKLPVLVLFLLFGVRASAQFTLEAEIRPRAEFRNGFKAPASENFAPAFFIEQRSRLYVGYKSSRVELQISLQDIRIWGSVSQIYKADPNMQNVYEAWGQYNFSERVGLRVGRMELDYDNARFLGNLDWAAQGRSHDAMLLLWKIKPGMKLDIGAAYNQNWRPEPTWLSGTFYDHTQTRNYKTMQFAHFSHTGERGKLSVLVHNDGRQVAADSSMAYRQTYAVLGDRKLGAFTLGGELYYQGGRNGSGTRVNALFAAFYATLRTSLTPVTLGGEYLSGNNPGDTEDRFFNPLYGTNHKFYGFMDYFYVGSPHSSKGLINLYLKTKFRLGEKARLLVDLHQFSSPTRIVEAATGRDMARNLGTEIDLVYNLKVHKDVTLHVGYSHMFATSSLVEIKGTGSTSAVSNWAWTMLTIRPALFSSENR